MDSLRICATILLVPLGVLPICGTPPQATKEKTR
jgi:hypothetical protein